MKRDQIKFFSLVLIRYNGPAVTFSQRKIMLQPPLLSPEWQYTRGKEKQKRNMIGALSKQSSGPMVPH